MKMLPAFVALTLAATAAARAEDAASRWQVHGSLSASGDVHSKDQGTIPVDALIAPAPSSTFAGTLDLGRDGARGGFKGTLLGVVWDPTADDRGAYGAVRARGFRDLSSSFRLTVIEDARLQRHGGAVSTDFERNELGLAFDQRLENGTTIGLLLADRRRSVRAQPRLGFSRQSLSLAATFAPGRATRLRLEGGGQHYKARTASGERLFASAALVHVSRRGTVGARVEAYSSGLGRGVRGASSILAPVVTPTPLPATPELPTPELPTPESPTSVTEVDDGRYLPSAIEPDAPGSAPVYTGPELAVDALLVQPFEEEDDWDFGRSRVGAQLFASRNLGRGWEVSGYLHLQHRDGPVGEDRLWARAAVRRRLSLRWSLLLQGSHLTSRVRATAPDFSRTLGSLGLQLRF